MSDLQHWGQKHRSTGTLYGIVGNAEAHPLGMPENLIACTLPAPTHEDALEAAADLAALIDGEEA